MDELARRGRAAARKPGGHYGGADHPLNHKPATTAAARGRPATHHRAHAKPHTGSHATKHATQPALGSEHALIQAFDAGTYTATIRLLRSPDVTLTGIPVSRAVASGTIAAGQTAAVLFFDHHNAADAMIVGVY